VRDSNYFLMGTSTLVVTATENLMGRGDMTGLMAVTMKEILWRGCERVREYGT
jgi:hypothetical protein